MQLPKGLVWTPLLTLLGPLWHLEWCVWEVRENLAYLSSSHLQKKQAGKLLTMTPAGPQCPKPGHLQPARRAVKCDSGRSLRVCSGTQTTKARVSFTGTRNRPPSTPCFSPCLCLPQAHPSSSRGAGSPLPRGPAHPVHPAQEHPLVVLTPPKSLFQALGSSLRSPLQSCAPPRASYSQFQPLSAPPHPAHMASQ